MQTLYIHPDNPQPRLLKQVVDALKNDQLIVYPTDTSYAFGCKIGSKNALAQLKQLRQLDDKHQFTLLCRDLSEIATYATVDNQQFKLLKATTPAPITFILTATKDVPKKLFHPKKKTIGIRVPTNPIAQHILELMQQPILTSSLSLPEVASVVASESASAMSLAIDDPFDIEEKLGNQIALLVNAGLLTSKRTTIIDMTQHPPILIRQGAADVSQIVAE